MIHPKDISIQDFTYDLPPEKIAAYPLSEREDSKLLVFKGGQINETIFRNVSSFLEKDTLLVFNDTKVIPARLNFLNSKQQALEIFCLEPNAINSDMSIAMSAQGSARWNCLVGNLRRWKEKELISEKNNIRLSAAIVERCNTHVVIDFKWEPSDLSFAEILTAIGRIPIPPYLNRVSEEIDLKRYQTVYAARKGSVAAPTAGLHFTEKILEEVKQKGADSISVTLHVGAGTFMPVKSDTMLGHVMHAEWIEVSRESIKKLGEQAGKPIIAVGTTSLRTIETLYWMGVKALLNNNAELTELEINQWDVYSFPENNIKAKDSLAALYSWLDKRGHEKLICRTRILIAPPYELKVATGIITNFHQPQSTLLLLISAIVGDRWKELYRYALDHDFRFLSYGDSSLLFK